MQLPPDFQTQAPPKPRNNTLVILMTVLVGGLGMCFILAMAVLAPVFVQAKLAAKASMAQAHLKQMTVGAIMYATDNDERLPLYENFADAITPASVLIDPVSEKQFAMNRKVAGKPLDTMEDTARVVLFYAGADEQFSYHFTSKRTAAAFCNGFAKLFKQEEADVVWAPTFSKAKAP